MSPFTEKELNELLFEAYGGADLLDDENTMESLNQTVESANTTSKVGKNSLKFDHCDW